MKNFRERFEASLEWAHRNPAYCEFIFDDCLKMYAYAMAVYIVVGVCNLATYA